MPPSFLNPIAFNMEKLIRQIEIPRGSCEETHAVLRRQWLATNGLGGYASGTISGGLNWRYHGLLVAALPEPYGRLMLLNQLAESIQLADGTWRPCPGFATIEPLSKTRWPRT